MRLACVSLNNVYPQEVDMYVKLVIKKPKIEPAAIINNMNMKTYNTIKHETNDTHMMGS